jgi:hypothetical protein
VLPRGQELVQLEAHPVVGLLGIRGGAIKVGGAGSEVALEAGLEGDVQGWVVIWMPHLKVVKLGFSVKAFGRLGDCPSKHSGPGVIVGVGAEEEARL